MRELRKEIKELRDEVEDLRRQLQTQQVAVSQPVFWPPPAPVQPLPWETPQPTAPRWEWIPEAAPWYKVTW
jgi:cell division septum initiation protein DivIVA